MTIGKAALVVALGGVVVAQVGWVFVFVGALDAVIGCDNRATGEACVYNQMGLAIWIAIEVAFLIACFVAFLIIRWRLEANAVRRELDARAARRDSS